MYTIIESNIPEFNTEIMGVGTGNITLFNSCVILHDDLPNVTLYLPRGVRLSFSRNGVVYRPDDDGVWQKSRPYFFSAMQGWTGS